MSETVKERYHPQVVAVNGTAVVTSDQLGGFLALTSGTITVTVTNSLTGATVTIVNAVPVTAGIWTPLPFYVGKNGCTVTLAGGASGTLGV